MQATHAPPGLRTALQDAQERIRAMGRVHEQLHVATDVATVSLETLLRDLCDELGRIYGAASDGETAQSRMEDILTANYSDGTQVDAVLSPYDGISRGIISALADAGYSVGEEWPIISGQDAEVDSVKAILSGEQYATIFKDTRELAKVAADMAVAVLNDEEPETNDTTTYDNDVKVVPSYLLAPVPVVKDNVQSALVDTGYWTAEELGL